MINHNTVYILTKLKSIITIVISFFQINQSFTKSLLYRTMYNYCGQYNRINVM